MKWYIGQPIVAIENHSQGIFKKGDEFVIHGINKSYCKCKNLLLLDIGIRISSNRSCGTCGVKGISTHVQGYSENKFAPLDQDISELLEILQNKEIA